MLSSWTGTHEGRRVRIEYVAVPSTTTAQWAPLNAPSFDESEAPDGLVVYLTFECDARPTPWSDILEWVMARYQEHLAPQPTQPQSFVPKRQRIPHPGKQLPSQVEPKALHVPHPRRDKP